VHPMNALTDQWLCAFGEFYANQRKQKEFEAALCCIIVQGDRRAEFQSLLGGQGTTIAHYYYERAAQIAHRDKGWGPQKRLLELLEETISGREKVADWHSRLPADDPAKVGPAGDRNMIAVLKRTYAILNHDGAYERQEEAPRRRAAVQPAPDAGSPPSLLEEAEAPDASLPTLPIDAPMDNGMHKACVIYRRQQKAFTASICNINKVPADRKVEYRSLLGSGGKTIEYHNYERAAELARRSDGQQRSNLVTLLRKIIGRREKVQKWHSRLHVDDTRRDKGPSHQNKIEVLMRTYKILTDGKSYKPKGPRKRRKGPAKRAAQKQLPLRAAQRQLLLEATQPIRIENAGEQRS
jgi:hypothetical protein